MKDKNEKIKFEMDIKLIKGRICINEKQLIRRWQK